jgi:hypothetical protein
MPDLFSSNPRQTSKEAGQLLPEGVLVQEYKSHKIRTAHLEDGTEVWVVSDIIAAITQSKNPRKYWNVIKGRMIKEGNQSVTNCNQLKIQASDGKFYAVDVMTREQVFRMLQSIPSKKAEPFKLWLAKLGNERLEEIENPDLAIQRGYEGYLKKGMSPAKAKARAKTVIHRNELTQKWLDHGINEPKEFAMLTDRESKGTFGCTTSEMKKEKSLTPAQNLRDNMTEAELLAQDASDVAISLLIDKHNPQGYAENVKEVDKGSTVGAGVMEMFRRVLAS